MQNLFNWLLTSCIPVFCIGDRAFKVLDPVMNEVLGGDPGKDLLQSMKPKTPKAPLTPAPVAAPPAPLGQARQGTSTASVINPEAFRRIPADPRRERRRGASGTSTNNNAAVTGAVLGSGI